MKRFRVAEIFGPTIQGEGRQVGLPCYFLRFGGCDLRCSWCDTPHAVLPELVAQLQQLTVQDIIGQIRALPVGPSWVVITGGNPALLELGGVVRELHLAGYNTMVETQGTIWKHWLTQVDELCVSPKPPSSGNMMSMRKLVEFITDAWLNLEVPIYGNNKMYLKVVVFNDDDYEYAREVHRTFREIPFFISAGNEDPSLPTVGNPYPEHFSGVQIDSAGIILKRETTGIVLDKTKWLTDKVIHDLHMKDVRVLPQVHVLLWGNERGH